MVLEKYTEERLREILSSYYELLSTDTPEAYQLKGRFNGYSEALLTLGQIDKTSLRGIIEEEHLRKFQMTQEARYYGAAQSASHWSDKDWSKFDQPTYIRQPRGCGSKKKK